MEVELESIQHTPRIVAKMIEVPPHYRTIRINSEIQYMRIPYTQFYFTDKFVKSFDVRDNPMIIPLTLTTSSKDSIFRDVPRLSIFPNTFWGREFTSICWGKTFSKTSPEELISYYWNSKFSSYPCDENLRYEPNFIVHANLPHIIEHNRMIYETQYHS